MSKRVNFYNQVLETLKELHKDYPSFSMGRHLSTVLSEYGDPWSISDKELSFALEKYKTQMELYGGIPIADDKEIERVIRDGQNLDKLFKEEEEDYE